MTSPDHSWADRKWAAAGIDEAAQTALAQGLPPTELWSLLLSIVEQRAVQRTPTAIRHQWESDRFVQPAAIDQRTLNELDSHLLEAAADFEAIELSPVAPLAVCSAVAPTSQNRVLSTIRGTEVVSDPTNVLALESARRLRDAPNTVVKFATSHRCVRTQDFPKQPGFAAHFRMFCLTTAGRERKDHAFLTETMIEHIRTHLTALARLEMHGYQFPQRHLTILSTPERAHLAQRIADAIHDLPVTLDALEHRYYDGLRFMIKVSSAEGNTIPFIDGGAFDWLRKLGANDRLVYVASAMGSQLAAVLFRRGG
jgi:hypothetical protein